MEFFHKLEDVNINFQDTIKKHSSDKSIIYKEVSGKPLYLGYYFPEEYDNAKKYPTFLFIHGGGWESHKVFADQTHWNGDYLGYLARYYADRGFVCVSIDYRLAIEKGQCAGYEIIDSYEDCCDAVDYVISHADDYGVDSDNLYLLGESAGGHLAGAVATFHYDRRYQFHTLFLVNPILHLDDGWRKAVPVHTVHPELVSLSMEERAKFLSPLYQVDEGIGSVVLIHGELDSCVSPEHSKMFYQRMCELSKPCDLHIIEGTRHAFLLAEYTKQQQACKIGIEIINGHLM